MPIVQYHSPAPVEQTEPVVCPCCEAREDIEALAAMIYRETEKLPSLSSALHLMHLGRLLSGKASELAGLLGE